MKDIEQSIEYLKNQGVKFYIEQSHQFGCETIFLSQQALVEYLDDPIGFWAKDNGVSKENYLNWSNENFSVICCATTKAGKRCKKIVNGGQFVSAQKWIEMQGSYCSVHEGM